MEVDPRVLRAMSMPMLGQFDPDRNPVNRDLLAGNELVRLAPEPDFGEIAKVPTVCNRAMAARRQAGDQS